MSYSEWETYKLGDLVESISVRHAFNKTKLIFLNTSDILNGKVLNKSYADINTFPGQAKKSIKKGDILFSEIRPKNKRFALVNFDADDYVVSTKLMVLRRKSDLIDNKFLYFYLTSDQTINYLQSIAEGRSGTFPQITFNELRDIKIKLPDINEQKAIANILSTLDEKIETNNQINEKLEEMAQALFKHWFVDFEFPNENGEPYKSSDGEMVDSELGMIPKGWEIVNLEDLTSKFTTGLNPRKNFVLGKGENYYVTIKNMGNNQIYLDDKCDKIDNDAIKKINKRSDLKKGDLLFSGIGTIGRVYLIDETPENWNISESIFTLRPSKLISSEILYLLLLSEQLQGYAQQLASGSVQKGVRMRDLKAYKLAIPSNCLIEKFTELIRPLIRKNKYLEKENKRLKAIRDTLLPKLMSGEIRVPLDDEVLSEQN